MNLSKSRQIKIGALLSYIAIGLNILSALIYSPWMLSKIGDSDYGIYSLASSLINFFLIDFGVGAAVTRFASKLLAEGRQDRVNEFMGVIYRLFFIVSAVIAVVLSGVYFFIDKIYAALTSIELIRFKKVYIIVALYSVFSFSFSTTVNGILTSYEKFISMRVCDVIHKLLSVGLIVVALLLGYGLYALVALTAVSNMIMLFVKFLIIKIKTPIKIKVGYREKGLLKEIFCFSIWALVNTICSRLIMSICPNILGITVGTFAITIFSFAAALEGYTYTFASALDGMFMPKIARIAYKDKNMDELLPLMTKVGRFQFALVGLIVVGFAIVGKEFVLLWLGKDYIKVYYCALLLMFPAPFYLSQQIGKNAMVMTNNIKYLAFVNIGKAIINVALVAVCSIYWGVMGVCVSICASYLLRNFANMILYQKKLELNMKKFSLDCYGKMALPMVLTLLLGGLGVYFYPYQGWLHLALHIICVILLYLVFMWFFALNAEEKSSFKNILKGLIRRIKGKGEK